MMKKLMVLSLVLAVSAMSSAALSLVAVDDVTAGVNVTDDRPVGFYVVWSASLTGAVELTNLGTGTLSYITPYGVNAGADLGFAGLGLIDVYEINTASTVPADLGAGIRAIAALNLEEGQFLSAVDQGLGLGQVDLLDFNLTQNLGTLYVVPEPMTMGLLGLGALFLRRRK